MSSYTPYVLSLIVGLAIGAIYGMLAVKSPAPPTIALLGLLGILAGEAGVQWLRGQKNIVQSCLHQKSFATNFQQAEPTDRRNG